MRQVRGLFERGIGNGVYFYLVVLLFVVANFNNDWLGFVLGDFFDNYRSDKLLVEYKNT